MKYGAIAAAALVCALVLAGCNNPSATPTVSATAATTLAGIEVTATTDIAYAIRDFCPDLAVVQGAFASGALAQPNAQIQAAVNTLASACPPNPPPTNAVAATVDLIVAYEAIQPLLVSLSNKK